MLVLLLRGALESLPGSTLVLVSASTAAFALLACADPSICVCKVLAAFALGALPGAGAAASSR